MATTASGERNNFHHLRHHHPKHDSYSFFNHQNYGSSKGCFLDQAAGHNETIASPNNNKDAASEILPLRVSAKHLSDDLTKTKSSHHLLPSIGEALLRREHYKEVNDASPSRTMPEDEFTERKMMVKIQDKSTENEMKLNAQEHSNLDEADKKEYLDVLNSGIYPIKSEGSQADVMLQHISSRNLQLLPLGVARGFQPDEVNALMSLENPVSGSVENIFRSEAHNSALTVDTANSGASHETPSYTTLTPLQPLPRASAVAEKYMIGGTGGYPPLMQKEAHDSNYNKMGGMGHTLPPLSNRLLLNGFAAQSCNDVQAQEAIEAVNQVAAAVNLSQYSKSSVLPPNIMNNPPSPQTLTTSNNSYETHMMFPKLNSHGNMNPAFQNGPVFQQRAGRSGFSPSYHQSLHEFPNSIQTETSIEKRLRSENFVQARRKPRNVADRVSASSSLTNFSPSSRGQQQIDEVNTKEVAEKITSELKRCSIPQAVFARQVLSRSQGTLSDLLRNPKPWSKLKSGRETFRKMWKWLQDPSNPKVLQIKAGSKNRFLF